MRAGRDATSGGPNLARTGQGEGNPDMPASPRLLLSTTLTTSPPRSTVAEPRIPLWSGCSPPFVSGIDESGHYNPASALCPCLCLCPGRKASCSAGRSLSSVVPAKRRVAIFSKDEGAFSDCCRSCSGHCFG